MAIEKITVPDLGEASDVEVIELLVTVGQQVAENDSLLVLESDKAAMEIPAPMAGIVKSIAINLGDTVSTGVEILSLEVESNNASAEPVGTSLQTKRSKPLQVEEPLRAAPASGKAEQPASIESVVTVPDLGTDDEVDVIEIHVSAGDRLEAINRFSRWNRIKPPWRFLHRRRVRFSKYWSRWVTRSKQEQRCLSFLLPLA